MEEFKCCPCKIKLHTGRPRVQRRASHVGDRTLDIGSYCYIQ
ncbi:MAG TPA: hypothetical protein V6C90_12550 [Coleofasciculaceae cyanobacterium]